MSNQTELLGERLNGKICPSYMHRSQVWSAVALHCERAGSSSSRLQPASWSSLGGICPDTIGLREQPRPGRGPIHTAPHSVHAWPANPCQNPLSDIPADRRRWPNSLYLNQHVWRPCEGMQIGCKGSGFVCTRSFVVSWTFRRSDGGQILCELTDGWFQCDQEH